MAKKKAVKKSCSKNCKKVCNKNQTKKQPVQTETKCPVESITKVSFCQKLYSFFFPVRS